MEWKHKPLTTAAGPSDAHLRPRLRPPAPAPAPMPTAAAKPSSRGGKEVTLAGLLRKKAVAAPAPAATPERDELEE